MQITSGNQQEGRSGRYGNHRQEKHFRTNDSKTQSRGQRQKLDRRDNKADGEEQNEQWSRNKTSFGRKSYGQPRKFNKFEESSGDKPKYNKFDGSNNHKPRQNKFEESNTSKPKYKKTYSGNSRNFHNDNKKHEESFGRFEETDGIRLNRYIAKSGICSRRDAEQYITAGVITINGKVVTELATKVQYGDVVKFNNTPLVPEKKTYILLNKPKDYITTTDDPHAEKTVMDLLGESVRNRVYPVGRLDRSTTGLLLLTNDGDLAEHLCHPRYNKQKIYQVTLDKKVEPSDIEKLLNGVELDDGPANADEIEYCNPDDKSEVGVVIHSGRNRIVRRMFESLGYKVKKLDRVYYAGLTKKNLPRGKWRFLTEKEIVMLKRGAYN